VGWLVYAAARKKRAVAEANLAACFGDRLPPAARRRIVYRCCQNVSTSMLELFKLARMKPQQIMGLVEVEGEEFLRAAAEQGKGVIVATAHYGNWELLGAVIRLLGYPLAVVAADARDPKTAALINQARRALGMQVLARDQLQAMLKALRRGEVLGLLPDQHYAVGGELLTFLGRPAYTALGPAVLALRSGAPLLVAFARRKSDGRFRVVFHPPLSVPDLLDRAEAARQLMQKVNDALSEEIRRHPEQWLWLHRRWRPVAHQAGAEENGGKAAAVPGEAAGARS
jgi:KDO2-lipid IV(A) lauroyltransferase